MEKKILDGSFIFSEDNSPNTNYSKIINMDICPAPFENNSYQTQMSGQSGDLPDRGVFFLRKRKGLEKAKFMRKGIVENVDDREFTDSKFVDGVRYLLAKSKDKKKIRIYKQRGFLNKDLCSDEEDAFYQEGWFENITIYQYVQPGAGPVLLDYFPSTDCLADKFAIGYGPKNVILWEGKIKAWQMQPNVSLPGSIKKGRIINKLIGNEVFTYFVDNDDVIISGNQGDYVYIYDGPYCSQHLGISGRELSVREGKQGLIMEGPFAGFAGLSLAPIETRINEVTGDTEFIFKGKHSDDIERSELCNYLLFQERGDVLYFATSNGIYSLNNDGETREDSLFVYEGNTHKETYNNGVSPLYVVSSLINKNDSIVFIDKKRGLLYHGLFGYQNTYFDPRNTLSVGGKYTDICVVSGYIILFGRESVALVNPQLISAGGITFGGFLKVSENVGYWNKDSWIVSNGVLSWFGSDKQYRKTIIETYGENAIIPKTEVQQTFYNALFSSLFRGRDSVYVGFDGRKEYLILCVRKGPILGRQDTIVIVKDFFWHKWIYSGFFLRGFDRQGAYGRGVFGYGSNRDDGREIRTLIQMNFGEYNTILGKEIILFKYMIGYNSTITYGNTLVRFEADYGGYKYKGTYGELYRRKYISDLMTAKSGASNAYTIIDDFGYGGNVVIGFGMTGIARTNKNIERESFNFSTDLFEWDKKTFDAISYELSKYGIIEEPVNLPCNNFVLEIMTRGDDEVEFGGFTIMYSLRDFGETRIEDVGIIGDTEYSGMSKKPLT